MKKLKIFSFILILNIFAAVFSPLSVHADDAAQSDDSIEPLSVDARAAILMNADTGEVYFSKDDDEKLFPASATRIMTALLTFEAVDRGDIALTDMVTASGTFQEGLDSDSSSQNIVTGETMSLENLLYCALVGSANEACNIIGEYVSGSIESFVSLMNSRAVELGCTDTHFVNCNGLPGENHYSTAKDLALIAAEALKYPDFLTIVNTVSREIPSTNKSDARLLTTANSLINPDITKYYFSDAKGIISGSTFEQGYVFVSSIMNSDMHIVSVVLGCEEVMQTDGSYNLEHFIQTKKMMKWLLNNYSLRPVLSQTDMICEVPVLLGDGADRVVAHPDSEISLILPNNLDLSTITKNVTIFSQQENAKPLLAPVSTDTVLGTISFSYNGVEYGPIDLVANTSISRSNLAYIKYSIHTTLGKTWVKWIIFLLFLIIVLYIVFVVRYNILRKRNRQAAKSIRGTANSIPPDHKTGKK